MKKINLAITGCMGRMGQQLIKSSNKNNHFKLVSLTENKKINKRIAGIKLDLNTELAFKKADVIVDFTVPECTLEILRIATKLKKRVIIGTTGFTQKEEVLIFDLEGRKVYFAPTEIIDGSSNLTIPIGHFSDGIYVIRVGNKAMRFPVVRQ